MERIPSAHVKIKLQEMLEWQEKRGKSTVHVTWYLRHIILSHESTQKSWDGTIKRIVDDVARRISAPK